MNAKYVYYLYSYNYFYTVAFLQAEFTSGNKRRIDKTVFRVLLLNKNEVIKQYGLEIEGLKKKSLCS